MEVLIEKAVQSITIRDDGMSDVMYLQTIAEKATGDVIAKSVVRETVETSTLKAEIEKLVKVKPEQGDA